MSFLLDSNILIYHLAGLRQATVFIRENPKQVISAVTRIEVLVSLPGPECRKECRRFNQPHLYMSSHT